MSDKTPDSKFDLELDLTIKFISVKLSDAQYELREMDAETRDQYLNKSTKRLERNEEGKATGLTSFDGHQTELLALCLIDTTTGKPVPQEVMKKWPASVTTKLFEKARELSGLSNVKDEAEAKAKKD